MTRLIRESNGASVLLGRRLGGGGEGEIHLLDPDINLVAKVYHSATPALAAKLRAMIANPPADPMAARGHVSIAWPVDLLLDPARRPAGYLMPRAANDRKLVVYYNAITRLRQSPLFQYQYLVATALNIASAAASLHDAGYVIGDVNESNILAGDNALVTLVDTDSFQVRDPRSGALFRCTVGKPEYTPPELQGIPFERVDRKPEHDSFGLAVLFFQLLLEGAYPFAGVYQRAGESPSREECISSGYFAYGRRARGVFRPPPMAVPFESLAPTVRELFLRCFDVGHDTPHARPNSREWREALSQAYQGLAQCRDNTQHWHGNHLGQCPWCERRTALRGLDPFPSRAVVQAKQHLRAPVPVPSPKPAPTPAQPNILTPPPRVQTPAPALPFLARVIRWFGAHRRLTFAAFAFATLGIWNYSSRTPQVATAAKMVAVAGATVNSKDGLTYIPIPAGTFRMGCSVGDTECSTDETVRENVKVAAFRIGQTLVTQAAYQRVMHANPSNFKGDQNPVEQVNWNEANNYCKAIGGKLPTEEQYEYAARAGTTGARYDDLDKIAWYRGNSGGKTHPVAQKQPNSYGLYDMLGNVWEWMDDWYDSAKTYKSLRGGSCFNYPRYVRVSGRLRNSPEYRIYSDGFRCVGE